MGSEKPLQMCRVGQSRTYTPHVTVYLVIFLPIIPYIHRKYIHINTFLANPFLPTLQICKSGVRERCVGGCVFALPAQG